MSLRIDEPQLYLVNTTSYDLDGLIYHAYNLSEPRQDLLVSVYPASVNQTLNVYIKFNEKPSITNYTYLFQVFASTLWYNLSTESVLLT